MWVSGQEGTTGNEKADELVRKETRGTVIHSKPFYGISLQTAIFTTDKWLYETARQYR